MHILRNLLGYRDDTLEERTVRNTAYLMDKKGFVPRFIIATSFGAGYDGESYNQILAQSIRDAREVYNENLHAIVQKEIELCLTRMGEEKNIHGIGEVYLPGEKSKILSKLSTKEILNYANDMLSDDLDLKHYRGLFIAHPQHVQRVMDRAKELEIEGKPFIRKDITWPASDSQPWVRGKWRFALREIAARIAKK